MRGNSRLIANASFVLGSAIIVFWFSVVLFSDALLMAGQSMRYIPEVGRQ